MALAPVKYIPHPLMIPILLKINFLVVIQLKQLTLQDGVFLYIIQEQVIIKGIIQ
jgi:hypothetical protein